MRANTPQELPGYNSLVSEVVTADSYGLKKLDFQPDVVFDLGANVGVFTRYARELFPEARIVSVEPDADNYHNLVAFTTNKRKHDLLCAAIGADRVWENINNVDKDATGAHGCFLSAGLGYPEAEIAVDPRVRPCDVPTVRVSELFERFVGPGERVLLKMDIEGNENSVFTHEQSMKCLRHCDYVAIEIHRYAISHELVAEVFQKTDEALKSFEATHDVGWNHVVFSARKR